MMRGDAIMEHDDMMYLSVYLSMYLLTCRPSPESCSNGAQTKRTELGCLRAVISEGFSDHARQHRS